MKRYALREVGTNKYLESYGSSGIGITHQEFKETTRPGLYLTASKANQALAWWRDGEARQCMDEEGYSDVSIKPVPHRKLVVVEIVHFELKEIGSVGTVLP